MLRLIKVRGDSLEPDVHSGEFVLVATLPAASRRLRPGDVVVLRHPAYGLLIKRVARLDAQVGAVYVLGTHPHSVDSRNFGPVPLETIEGKVIWRIGRPG